MRRHWYRGSCLEELADNGRVIFLKDPATQGVITAVKDQCIPHFEPGAQAWVADGRQVEVLECMSRDIAVRYQAGGTQILPRASVFASPPDVKQPMPLVHGQTVRCYSNPEPWKVIAVVPDKIHVERMGIKFEVSPEHIHRWTPADEVRWKVMQNNDERLAAMGVQLPKKEVEKLIEDLPRETKEKLVELTVKPEEQATPRFFRGGLVRNRATGAVGRITQVANDGVFVVTADDGHEGWAHTSIYPVNTGEGADLFELQRRAAKRSPSQEENKTATPKPPAWADELAGVIRKTGGRLEIRIAGADPDNPEYVRLLGGAEFLRAFGLDAPVAAPATSGERP